MILHSMIVDSFLGDFNAARAHLDGAIFGDARNPQDGVVYPGICLDIPQREEVIARLSATLGHAIKLHWLFARISRAGEHAPHQAHTDVVMGQYTLILYMNRPEHCVGGTTILIHKSGMHRHPQTEEERAMWQQDCNDAEKWWVVGGAPMMANRGFIVRSDVFHRSEPIGGFGQTPRDARMVIVGFFDFA
jgi:hypothetical protein